MTWRSVGALAVLIVGLYSYRALQPEPTASAPEPEIVALAAVSTPAPLPTEIDANFSEQITKCVLPISSLYGYDLYISSAFRSFAEQDAMYAKGRTVVGRIYTNAKGGGSVHNYGLAADFADHKYGQSIDWNKLGKIGEYCGLEHGDRGYEDLPHFQHVQGLSNDDLLAGKRPTPLVLPCPALSNDSVTKKDLADCGTPNFGSGSVNAPAKIIEDY